MGYSELIKSYGRIRAYLRSFYVYGFRHRDEYTQKSARSYDNERRRAESWLGDYMRFGQDPDGRRVFLSVDSRDVPENPLYRAFRTKSFTDLDITLHFHLMDLFRDLGEASITEVMDDLTDRLSEFDSDDLPDEATVRRKLREYTDLGILTSGKRGRETVYRLCETFTDLSTWQDAAAFFSEALPVGVVGSYIRSRLPERDSLFRFKHHYILNALDSEILCELLSAMTGKRTVTVSSQRSSEEVVPVRLYIGTQSGRQYLLDWSRRQKRFEFRRADLIDSVKPGPPAELPEGFSGKLDRYLHHTWGVAGTSRDELQHVEMTVAVCPWEGFIPERLEREKRCGTVRRLDESHWLFTADVYSVHEMLPWIRTFIGRITDLQCSVPEITELFRSDLKEMAEMYGGDGHAVS